MKEQRRKFNVFVVILLIVLTGFIAAVCVNVNAQQQVETPSIEKQWRHSPHAGSMDDPKERIRMNRTGCAHCHTAQGYWEVILAGKKSTAPYKDPVGITCIACHTENTNGTPNGLVLRSGRVTAACKCHDILVQNDTEDFSHCPQGSLVKGKGGAEFKGKQYGSGAHSGIQGNCVGCHMAQSPAGEAKYRLGGHTFRVITKGETPRQFNANGCRGCHEGITYEFVLESQARIRQLMDTLAGLLPQKPEPSASRPNEKPKLPEDPSLNRIEAMASYNYYTVLRDGTYGVHNPVYIRQLLKHSIEALHWSGKNRKNSNPL